MKTTYNTVILGVGKYAAIEIPPENLAKVIDTLQLGWWYYGANEKLRPQLL
jgi:hypothetical protein